MVRTVLLRSVRASTSTSSASTFTPIISRSKHSAPSPWPSKSHLRASPSIPPPLPALYPHTVILSDGSSFTAHTTNPSPATIRLTRDVTNNPLWAPGTEKRGLGDGEAEGRVGRFRKRFEGLQQEASEGDDAGAGAGAGAQGQLQGQEGKEGLVQKVKRAFAETDLDWMSEGAVEEKAVKKEVPVAAKGKGKKK